MELTQSHSKLNDERLGKCEVCNFNAAKYTCPKCEVKTCQLECIKIHKKELNCDGIRDKTKYIPLKKITEADLMSDYVFLESCTNYTSARQTDKTKKLTFRNRSLPISLIKLKKAAAHPDRQIKLNFLLPNFDKHKTNTTHYDWTSKVISWCIEWRFINANNKIIIDKRCNESQLMSELIEKYFDYSSSISSLACYRLNGMNNVTLLLKAEAIRKSKNRFFSMDLTKTLKDNLRGKSIVEYPVVYVIFNSHINNYDIINNDEENVMEETRKHKNHYFPTSKTEIRTKESTKKNQKTIEATSTAATYNSKKAVNFLFSNGSEFIDDDDEDDDGDDNNM